MKGVGEEAAKRPKYILVDIRGTLHSKVAHRPPAALPAKFGQHTESHVVVGAKWARCPSTSNTSRVLCFCSIAQCTLSPRRKAWLQSSAESGLYAMWTGAGEALHVRPFLPEAQPWSKLNTVMMETDASSGKNIATMVWTTEKTQHIQPRHLHMQETIHEAGS